MPMHSHPRTLLLLLETGVAIATLPTSAWAQTTDASPAAAPSPDPELTHAGSNSKPQSVIAPSTVLAHTPAPTPETTSRAQFSSMTSGVEVEPTQRSEDVPSPPTSLTDPMPAESLPMSAAEPELTTSTQFSPKVIHSLGQAPEPETTLPAANSQDTLGHKGTETVPPTVTAAESEVPAAATDETVSNLEALEQSSTVLMQQGPEPVTPNPSTRIASGSTVADPETTALVEQPSETYSTAATDLLPPEPEFENTARFATATQNSLRQSVSPEAALAQSTLSPNGLTADLPGILPTLPDVDIPDADPAYIVEPYEVTNNAVSPEVTTFRLNGTNVNHLMQWQVASGLGFGDGRSTNFDFVGTFSLNNTFQQSITADNILRLDQSSQFMQTLDVLTERQLTLSRRDPYTLLGQEIQMSLTANCTQPGTNPNQFCTYTPGLSTDRNSLDPQFRLPTRIDQTSDFGDVVTAESLAAMQAPGFQRGANGQLLGLDLYFPNSGAVPGNDFTTASQVNRYEQFSTTPAVSFANFNQNLRANASEAVLTRTIQAPTLFWDEDQPVTNILLAIASLLLPRLTPNLSAATTPVNPDLNQGLFLAANNSRLPEGSLTLYQTGIGSAPTPQTTLQDIGALPHANFNTVWLGLSPVTERSYVRSNSFYEMLDDPRIIAAAGAEGGVVNNVSLVSAINGLPFTSNNLANSYTQIYLKFFEQDANLVNTIQQTDRITYYPHVSFSGNITGPYDVFRYYTGIIAANQVMAYAGLDYAVDTPDGWSYNLGAIGYINPSYDYYSRLSGGISKRLELSPSSSLVLGSSLNWAIDQDTQRGDIEERAQGSDITARAQLTVGPISLGIAQIFGDVLPNSKDSRTLSNFAWRLSDQLSLAGYLTLMDDSTTSPRAGMSLNWRLTNDPASPIISIGWNNTLYNYGRDLFNQPISARANTFNLSFRMGL